MTARRFRVLIDFVNDRRAPRALRKLAFRGEDGRSGVLGATTPGRMSVYVDAAAVAEVARELRQSFVYWLLRTIDHEYAHAFIPPGWMEPAREEPLANAFERAGAWARR